MHVDALHIYVSSDVFTVHELHVRLINRRVSFHTINTVDDVVASYQIL